MSSKANKNKPLHWSSFYYNKWKLKNDNGNETNSIWTSKKNTPYNSIIYWTLVKTNNMLLRWDTQELIHKTKGSCLMINVFIKELTVHLQYISSTKKYLAQN